MQEPEAERRLQELRRAGLFGNEDTDMGSKFYLLVEFVATNALHVIERN